MNCIVGKFCCCPVCCGTHDRERRDNADLRAAVASLSARLEHLESNSLEDAAAGAVDHRANHASAPAPAQAVQPLSEQSEHSVSHKSNSSNREGYVRPTGQRTQPYEPIEGEQEGSATYTNSLYDRPPPTAGDETSRSGGLHELPRDTSGDNGEHDTVPGVNDLKVHVHVPHHAAALDETSMKAPSQKLSDSLGSAQSEPGESWETNTQLSQPSHEDLPGATSGRTLGESSVSQKVDAQSHVRKVGEEMDNDVKSLCR